MAPETLGPGAEKDLDAATFSSPNKPPPSDDKHQKAVLNKPLDPNLSHEPSSKSDEAFVGPDIAKSSRSPDYLYRKMPVVGDKDIVEKFFMPYVFLVEKLSRNVRLTDIRTLLRNQFIDVEVLRTDLYWMLSCARALTLSIGLPK